MNATETLRYCALLRQCEPMTLTSAFYTELGRFRHAVDEGDDEWAEASASRLHAMEVYWFPVLGYWPDDEPVWHTVPY